MGFLSEEEVHRERMTFLRGDGSVISESLGPALEKVKEASWRYQFDADFHMAVDRVVNVIAASIKMEIPEGMPQRDRMASTLAVAVTLLMKDEL